MKHSRKKNKEEKFSASDQTTKINCQQLQLKKVQCLFDDAFGRQKKGTSCLNKQVLKVKEQKMMKIGGWKKENKRNREKKNASLDACQICANKTLKNTVPGSSKLSQRKLKKKKDFQR